jgi:Mg-chelatase subunit ChlD
MAAEKRLELLKESLELAIEDPSLGEKDQIAIISFDNETTEVLAMAHLTAGKKDEALSAAKAIETRGGTDIRQALELGVSKLTADGEDV